VLVTYHDQHPDRTQQARRARPDGPLAVSDLERRAQPSIARRYDVILASRHWKTVDVIYGYEAAVAAGSDHGRLVAQLDLR
jgi:hypothetical protein